MAYLATRGSGAVNGVSRLHGEVSRRIFQPLYPRWPEAEVPVAHVTNGVHTPSWDSPAADLLWTKAFGASPWSGTLEAVAQGLGAVGDDELWAMRSAGRRNLVEVARERVGDEARLEADVLTLGFARRFATYKRANLLLTDPARLLRILTDA